MKISQLIRNLPANVVVLNDDGADVTSLSTDSRNVLPGAMFFCIPGMHIDAHDFAPQVADKGAVALVVERKLDINIAQVLVPSVRQAMSYIAAAFYGNPAQKLKLIGITGTKGKTTTSFLVKSILEEAGHSTGMIGTVCTMIGNRELSSGKTTPDPLEFQQLLRLMADAGMEYVVMEVSAHALAMHRVEGVMFDAAGFSNLSQDHLDYFKTMDNYLMAKMRLMTPEYTKHAIVNIDDENVYAAVKQMGIPHVTTGIRERADVYVRDIEICESGYTFMIGFHKRCHLNIHLKLSGLFNVYNALMAAALCDAVNVDWESIRKGLESVVSVPGRIELLDTHTPYRVILDYAHSPDALENILRAVRQTTSGRVIALFGCGGGRDHGKRPMMGEIGGRLADYCILTSDNPRDEDPMTIIDAVEEGIRPTGGEYVVIENRRAAIRHALTRAKAGDTVVLAGKGHETYQEIMGVKHPFDEKIVVQELLDEIAGL